MEEPEPAPDTIATRPEGMDPEPSDAPRAPDQVKQVSPAPVAASSDETFHTDVDTQSLETEALQQQCSKLPQQPAVVPNEEPGTKSQETKVESALAGREQLPYVDAAAPHSLHSHEEAGQVQLPPGTSSVGCYGEPDSRESHETIEMFGLDLLLEATRKTDSETLTGQTQLAIEAATDTQPVDSNCFDALSAPEVEDPGSLPVSDGGQHSMSENLAEAEAVRSASSMAQVFAQEYTDHMPNTPFDIAEPLHPEVEPLTEDETEQSMPSDPTHGRKRDLDSASLAETSLPAAKRIRLQDCAKTPVSNDPPVIPDDKTNNKLVTGILYTLKEASDRDRNYDSETLSDHCILAGSLPNDSAQRTQLSYQCSQSATSSSSLSDHKSEEFNDSPLSFSEFLRKGKEPTADAATQTTEPILVSRPTQTLHKSATVSHNGTQPDPEWAELNEAARVWERELNTIRRPKPLFEGEVITVKVEYREDAKSAPAGPAPKKMNQVQPSEIIDLSDSPPPEAPPSSRQTRPKRHAVNKTLNGTARRGYGSVGGGRTPAASHIQQAQDDKRLIGHVNDVPAGKGSGQYLANGQPYSTGQEIVKRRTDQMDRATVYQARPSERAMYSSHLERRFVRDNPEKLSFYLGNSEVRPLHVEDELRFQDRHKNIGEMPGPKAGLRLKVDKYLRESGAEVDNAVALEDRIQHILQTTYYGFETLDEDQAYAENWGRDRYITLYNGFPLVESVTFAALGNYARPDGDCYWSALAYMLQGNRERWNVVKAEHLEYLYHVLSDKAHPRHSLYADQLNKRFFNSHGATVATSEGGSLRFDSGSRFKANIWQLLHLPHSWTPGAMQQITADLYNLHLVTFSYDSVDNACTEVQVRGGYSSRHVFMLFIDGQHFQPLTPNEHLGWEFLYPRLSVAATARYKNAPKSGAERFANARQHPWRNDWTREVPPPVARNHGCDLLELSKCMKTMDARKKR